MSDHHWYASTVYDWITAATKEQVIKKLARISGSMITRTERGLSAVVCRVELPERAHYRISEYLPSKITKEDGVNEMRKGELVPLSEVENIRLLNTKGKYEVKPKQE